MNTTITVTQGFAPQRPGERIQINNANGKGVWRTYTVGAKLFGDGASRDTVYSATMEGRFSQ